MMALCSSTPSPRSGLACQALLPELEEEWPAPGPRGPGGGEFGGGHPQREGEPNGGSEAGIGPTRPRAGESNARWACGNRAMQLRPLSSSPVGMGVASLERESKGITCNYRAQQLDHQRNTRVRDGWGLESSS